MSGREDSRKLYDFTVDWYSCRRFLGGVVIIWYDLATMDLVRKQHMLRAYRRPSSPLILV